MTARARGSDASLQVGVETDYGVAAASAYSLYCSSVTFGAQIGLENSDLIGVGREPSDATDGSIDVKPQVTVPVDLREFGVWLMLLLGPPVTSGSNPSTHEFSSGAATLPSATLDVGFVALSKYYRQLGFVANELKLDWRPDGKPAATITGVAQSESLSGTVLDATPTTLAISRFSAREGFVKSGGVSVGNLVGGNLSYSNGVDVVRTIRSDGLIEGIDPGMVALSGEIRVRLSDLAILDAADSRTPVSLEFGYYRSASKSITFTLHRALLSKPQKQLNGAAGLEVTLPFQASRSASDGNKSMTVTLVNDVAGYS
ncbi:MAG: phage tail tube protein [Alphaproteobacteria bacterium]